MDRLDPSNWLQHPITAINPRPGERWTHLPRTYRSPLLLIRWFTTTPRKFALGEIQPEQSDLLGHGNSSVLGVAIGSDRRSYQLWQPTINNGQPYRLKARLIAPLPKFSTSLQVWEFNPEGLRQVIPAGQQAITFNTDLRSLEEKINQLGIKIMSYTSVPTPQSTANEGFPLPFNNPVTGTPMVLAAAKANRLSGFGTNNTNKNLWILFASTPIAPAKPAILIPPGGNFEIPDLYVGTVQGFISPGGSVLTGTIDLVEFNAQ